VGGEDVVSIHSGIVVRCLLNMLLNVVDTVDSTVDAQCPSQSLNDRTQGGTTCMQCWETHEQSR
jgi:hypothetical protein